MSDKWLPWAAVVALIGGLLLLFAELVKLL
jgi:hypothetical protein